VRLDLESLKKRGHHLADWIDKLKQQEDEARQHTHQQLKLRASRIVDAKLPGFWRIIVDFTEAQAKRLQDTFPNKPEYATKFSRDIDGFTLTQLGTDHREIIATLDKNARRVRVKIIPSQRLLPDSPPIPLELSAGLTAVDELYLVNPSADKMYTQPEDAAEWFIRTVCGITTVAG
jgi:hypothetical protein